MFWERLGLARRESAGWGMLAGCTLQGGRTVGPSGDAKWKESEATEVAAKGLLATLECFERVLKIHGCRPHMKTRVTEGACRSPYRLAAPCLPEAAPENCT